jgi:hypothetical protein
VRVACAWSARGKSFGFLADATAPIERRKGERPKGAEDLAQRRRVRAGLRGAADGIKACVDFAVPQ